jgi:hypothetical protein
LFRNGSGWQYAGAALTLAGIAAWVSYNDGLFVARLAGNHDVQAFAYPLLPDGLIVVCLLALVEAARAGVPRPGWAQAGLVLGIAATLAVNAGAGFAHSVLDAVLDGLVPVVFLIAFEVVLWHVKRGRGEPAQGDSPAAPPRTVPPDRLAAAKACHAATAAAGNPLSQNQLTARFGITRAEAKLVVQGPPAGMGPPALAGVSGRDALTPAPPPVSVPAASNGHPRG